MSIEGVWKDIVGQPASLSRAIDFHTGAGLRSFEGAAEAIRQAPAVILTGMGASLFACAPLEYFLAARGVRVRRIETGELLHYQTAACEGAAVVMVSRSGDTVEVSRLLASLAGTSVVIGVTNEGESCLARGAHHVLLVRSLPDEFVALQSYSATLATLLLLGAAVCAEPLDDWRHGFDRAIAGIEPLVGRSLEYVESSQEMLVTATSMHLQGRGPSCGSCEEGALLFNEVAKLAAIPSPAGLFRHGPVEVVDGSYRGFVFAPAGKTRRLNLELARDLAHFNGEVRVIGPSGGEAQGLPLWETPAVDDTFAPLVEIVPLQVATWRLAQWRGLVPGDFRYVARVTLDEARLHASKI